MFTFFAEMGSMSTFETLLAQFWLHPGTFLESFGHWEFIYISFETILCDLWRQGAKDRGSVKTN